VPKIVINDTVNFFSKTAISGLVISNHNSFRVLFDKIVPYILEAQLSPRDRAMRRVSGNLASCHAAVQKLLVRQVLNKSKL